MKTSEMSVELIDYMGSDLSVVNSARVSFDKESGWEIPVGTSENYLSEKDQKLISYLAKHNHWTPFAHNSLSFRIKAPVFVARQLVKHQVGGVWNEVSRRYVDSEVEIYFPDKWRKRADNVKQGSSEEEYTNVGLINEAYNELNILTALYNKLVLNGCAPEQARMILPQNTMTTWIWTGSLAFFARVCKLRLDPHAQQETQDIAKLIQENIPDEFKHSWKALMNGN